jgi:pimeloyl-ACP methyl ester carboxylesterase
MDLRRDATRSSRSTHSCRRLRPSNRRTISAAGNSNCADSSHPKPDAVLHASLDLCGFGSRVLRKPGLRDGRARDSISRNAASKGLARFQEPVEDARIERISEVDRPTLILWGERDRLRPPTYASRFATAISGSQVRVYPQVGHVPMEEASTESANDAQNFLAGTLD